MIRRLVSADGPAALEVVFLLLVSEVAFLLPTPVLLGRWTRSALRASDGLDEDVRTGRELARIVAGVLRRLPLKALCLQRSLVLVSLLRRRRLGARLRIGVRRTEEGLLAHAWVEVDGIAVNDSIHNCARFDVLESADLGIQALRRRAA